MTLHVVTLQFGAIPYFGDSRALNEAYCARHGLPFIVRQPAATPERHEVWSKVALVLDELHRAERVLFLDADAVFVDHAEPPRCLLEMLGNKALLFGRDASGQANTGVFLARRSDVTTRILCDWWAVVYRDPTYAFRWPLEQGALNRHIIPKHGGDIALPSRDELDIGPSGTFIRHHAAQTVDAKRRAIATERARVGV